MKPVTVKRLRLLGGAASVLLLIALALAAWFYVKMRASLPLLDGQASIAGLGANVTVERDAQGVPTLRGSSRLDVAAALGFLHAQDRFFQMDCSRRHAAGELAELFGKAALPHDRLVRIHGFRTLAQQVLKNLSADERELIEAYTKGVNVGLARLGTKPFEYILTRNEPQPWKAEDCVLMVYAMTLDLQDEDAVYEQSLAALHDTLGQPALAYFAPLIGPEDAALDNTTASLAPMPTERMIDIRRRTYTTEEKHASLTHRELPEVLPGSNAFALSGKYTDSGAALLANDMHLKLRVPNTWYRASLVFPATNSQGETRVTGVTLPGAPLVIAGSNGHIAWGFTNAYADTSDLIVVNATTAGPGTYMNGDKVLLYEKRTESIRVKGNEPETISISSTIPTSATLRSNGSPTIPRPPTSACSASKAHKPCSRPSTSPTALAFPLKIFSSQTPAARSAGRSAVVCPSASDLMGACLHRGVLAIASGTVFYLLAMYPRSPLRLTAASGPVTSACSVVTRCGSSATAATNSQCAPAAFATTWRR